jgi:hypothetical protein
MTEMTEKQIELADTLCDFLDALDSALGNTFGDVDD